MLSSQPFEQTHSALEAFANMPSTYPVFYDARQRRRPLLRFGYGLAAAPSLPPLRSPKASDRVEVLAARSPAERDPWLVTDAPWPSWEQR